MEGTKLQNTRNNADTQISKLIELISEQANHIFDLRQTWKFGKPQKLARGGTLEKSRTQSTTQNSRNEKVRHTSASFEMSVGQRMYT